MTIRPNAFASPDVDRALDAIRYSVDEASYKQGVRLLQEAIVRDPPALFLAWEERARAVSRRFEVQAIPTLVLLDHGELVDKQIGALSEHQLRSWLESKLPKRA